MTATRDGDASTIDAAEVARFDALARSWWDPKGPMAVLHKFNPVRLGFVRDLACARLAADRIPLTVCPLSNVKLCVYQTMDLHQLPALLAAGLVATVNSDDPAYFGGYMNANFLATFEALPQLGAREAYQLARNSFEASFVTPEARARWVAALDASFAAA